MGGAHSGGGSLILAGLIDQAGEAIFQDFQEIYGVNLVHMIRDDVSPYEIVLLLRGLKVGSRFVSALQGSKDFEDWTVTAYQLATLIDAVNYVTYAVIAANSGRRKPKEPKKAYRPQKERRKNNNMFRQQLELAKQRKAEGG